MKIFLPRFILYLYEPKFNILLRSHLTTCSLLVFRASGAGRASVPLRTIYFESLKIDPFHSRISPVLQGSPEQPLGSPWCLQTTPSMPWQSFCWAGRHLMPAVCPTWSQGWGGDGQFSVPRGREAQGTPRCWGSDGGKRGYPGSLEGPSWDPICPGWGWGGLGKTSQGRWGLCWSGFQKAFVFFHTNSKST